MIRRNTRGVAVSGIVIAGLVLSGCAAGGDEADSNDDNELVLINSMPAATGDIESFTWNLPGGEPFSVDPSTTGVSNQTVYANLCENLMVLNPDYTVSPNLAEVVQADDVTYEVSLRDDVTFWDGTYVTADDAIYSLERQRDPSVGANSTALQAVQSIDKVDDLHFTIRLSQPDADFYAMMAAPVGNVIQKKFAEEAGDSFGKIDGGVMCTGPLMIKEWNSGDSIVLEKYEDYWDSSRASHAKTVRLFFNTDTASTVAALVSGETDGVFESPISALPQLQKADGTLSLGPSPRHYTVNFVNVPEGPVSDVRLREALALAIDYEGIIAGPLLGFADTKKALVPNVSFNLADQPVYDEYLKNSPNGKQDIERAKKLVEEAGVPDRPLVFAYPNNLPENAQIATAIQAAGKEIGIEITLDPYDLPGLLPAILGTGEGARDVMDMIMWQGILDVPPSPTIWYRKYMSGSTFEFSRMQSPEFDDLVAKAIATIDDAERAELIVEAQKILDETVLTISLTSNVSRTYIAPGLTGVPTSGMYNNVPWAAMVGTK